MGSGTSSQYTKKKKVLAVISLNYSGILLSPFEFFSKQKFNKYTQIEQSLSRIFKDLLKIQFKEFSENKAQNKFKWNLGKIDQKMQKQRYSPLYHPTAGILQGKLVDMKKFQQLWEATFEKRVKQIKELQYTQQNKQQAKKFDLLCYKCILAHIYEKDIKKDKNAYNFEKVETLNPSLYQLFMNKMFDKSFLKQQKKLQKTFSAMDKEDIDIVFAQEANQRLIKQLEKKKQYVVFKSEKGDSIIVCKAKIFNNFYSLKNDPLNLLPEIKKKLFWNEDTVVAFVDNLILISGHLSSKKEKNPQQVYQMIESLKLLSALYPMCHIIVGCDGNSFIPEVYQKYLKEHNKNGNLQKNKQEYNRLFPLNWQIFPSNSKSFTTSKERTYLQPQINKAEEVARVCRDYIIVIKGPHIQIRDQKVCTILNKPPTDVPNLPCEQHPYDHYVIKSEIIVNVVTNFQDKKQKPVGCY